MESLGSVRTIMGIVQDILTALETASRNKSRCDKVADRVRCIKDMLEAAAQEDGATTPTRSLLLLEHRLEAALGRALEVVRRCQRIGFLRSVMVAGGRMADPLDGVEAEIDRCMLDLAVASSLRIARLETTLVARRRSVEEDREEEEDEDKGKASAEKRKKKKKKKAGQVTPIDGGGGAEMNHENTTAATTTEEITTAIGVPVCTVTATVPLLPVHEHKHETMELPPPSYGYGYHGYMSYGYGYWRSHGCTCDCWDDNAHGGGGGGGGPSDGYRSYGYPSMFSDDNPNSCSIL